MTPFLHNALRWLRPSYNSAKPSPPNPCSSSPSGTILLSLPLSGLNLPVSVTLTGSDSPQSDLHNLQCLRASAAVKALLQFNRELAAAAGVMSRASPDRFRIRLNNLDYLPDGQTITQMRDQFIGNEKGLLQLERFLDQLEKELSEKIIQQDNKAR